MLRWAVIGVCVGMVAVAAAQEPELPAFEVASIKPQTGSPAYVPSAPDRFTNSQATLHSLIAYGWDVRSFQIEGGPEWGGSRRFDVSARAPRLVDQPTMRLMVRRLLAERFALRTHVEMRELPIYALVAARRDGDRAPGLTPAAVDCAAVLAERGGAPAPPGSPAPACAWRIGLSPPIARMYVDGAPMREFAGLLEQLLRRAVRDETGLTGAFDVRLDFSMEGLDLPVPPVEAKPTQTDVPSLFSALEEQLGLKLESRRGPVPVVVIDGAEPPTAD